ncbi:hypothetical protein Gain_0077_022 [Komagataeibacter intermedius TF2]|uniref:Uncharacterized protein n=1 Tax=Komagataeibacter intermedius NRIC 0521 TaxID=1307934 RepID=A0ABQ0PMI3_9PROT|nr:hypothetical protein Gain_0077_022 [Komagataeibacter intermedius TF2]GBQ75450.1 hypothetical protein AA0521_2667 [Komagataeibacter intermedius NRIC 0521]
MQDQPRHNTQRQRHDNGARPVVRITFAGMGQYQRPVAVEDTREVARRPPVMQDGRASRPHRPPCVACAFRLTVPSRRAIPPGERDGEHIIVIITEWERKKIL